MAAAGRVQAPRLLGRPAANARHRCLWLGTPARWVCRTRGGFLVFLRGSPSRALAGSGPLARLLPCCGVGPVSRCHPPPCLLRGLRRVPAHSHRGAGSSSRPTLPACLLAVAGRPPTARLALSPCVATSLPASDGRQRLGAPRSATPRRPLSGAPTPPLLPLLPHRVPQSESCQLPATRSSLGPAARALDGLAMAPRLSPGIRERVPAHPRPRPPRRRSLGCGLGLRALALHPGVLAECLPATASPALRALLCRLPPLSAARLAPPCLCRPLALRLCRSAAVCGFPVAAVARLSAVPAHGVAPAAFRALVGLAGASPRSLLPARGCSAALGAPHAWLRRPRRRLRPPPPPRGAFGQLFRRPGPPRLFASSSRPPR